MAAQTPPLKPGEKVDSIRIGAWLADMMVGNECRSSPVVASIFSVKQETGPSVERGMEGDA